MHLEVGMSVLTWLRKDWGALRPAASEGRSERQRLIDDADALPSIHSVRAAIARADEKALNVARNREAVNCGGKQLGPYDSRTLAIEGAREVVSLFVDPEEQVSIIGPDEGGRVTTLWERDAPSTK
jgi:hypothetical protein